MLGEMEGREGAEGEAEELLRESEERYALAARGANDGLWDWKLATNQIYFSSRWSEMLGYNDREVWSDPEEWFSRIHPADRQRVQDELAAHRDGLTHEFVTEYRMQHKSGTLVWMLSRGQAVRDEHGLAVRIAGSQTDITEGKVADPLTGLPNRLYFLDRAANLIEARPIPPSRGPGDAVAVLFIDLDRLK